MAVVWLGLLTGCGAVGTVKGPLGLGPPHVELERLSVSADPGANLDNVTQLDVVVAYSDAAVAMLRRTDADWFRQRDALQRALAEDIAVVSLQVPSASPLFKVKLPKRTRNGKAVYVFANYAAAAGWPLIDLTAFKQATLRLRERSIDVSGK